MGHTPYGYKIENGKAVIDEEKAEQIRQLYEGYLSGLGLTDAANHAGLSIPHRQAKLMMLNEKYLGTDFYPPITTRDVIDRVKEELHKRAAALGRLHKSKEKVIRHPPTDFRFDCDLQSIEDPFLRAEQRYQLIREVAYDG